MIDILAIASTLVVVAIFLYLRFGIRKHFKKLVRSEFHAVVEEVRCLQADKKRDDQHRSDSK